MLFLASWFFSLKYNMKKWLLLLVIFASNAFATTGITIHATGGSNDRSKDRRRHHNQILGISSTTTHKDSDKAGSIYGADITFQSPFG